MRRTWSAKRTPKLVNEFEIQDQHNSLANDHKTMLREIYPVVMRSSVQVNMGADGEWEFNTLNDSLTINAAQEVTEEDGESPSEEDIVQFVTPTLMGRVNDEMNNMVR
jgi:hypothetical protein